MLLLAITITTTAALAQGSNQLKAEEFVAKSYSEMVKKVLSVQLSNSEIVEIYKFSTPQFNNSEYLVLDSNGKRVVDKDKLTQSIISDLTRQFALENSQGLTLSFDNIKASVEPFREDNDFKKALNSIISSKFFEQLLKKYDLEFFGAILSTVKPKDYNDLSTKLNSLARNSEKNLLTDPINFKTDVSDFYINEITIEETLQEILGKHSPSKDITKITASLSQLQAFSIPEKQKIFRQKAAEETFKIEQRVNNKRQEATTALSHAQNSTEEFKKKIKTNCRDFLSVKCSLASLLKQEHTAFASRITRLPEGNEQFNQYINEMNKVIDETGKESERIQPDIQTWKFNLSEWWDLVWWW